MQTSNAGDRKLLYLLLSLVILFTLGRYLAQYLSGDAWSFTHWQFLPVWYGPVWITVLAGLGYLVSRTSVPEKLTAKAWFIPAVAVALLALLWFGQFDSFVYGGGNLRASQIGQAGKIVVRWFEFGSVLLVKLAYGMTSSFVSEPVAAAALAWKCVSFFAAAISAIGAWFISRSLSQEKLPRLYIFLIVFLGPQALLQFGYVGVEPLLAAATVWFLYACVRLADHYSRKNLLLVWGVLALGCACHISLIFLFPAALFVTLSGSSKGVTRPAAGLTGAALGLAVLVVALYFRAGRNLELSSWLLFTSGVQPRPDYGLFSLQHLFDLFQIVFLAAPTIFLAFYLRVVGRFDAKSRVAVFATCLSQIGGLVALFVLDPKNSSPLDFPRFVLFLAPTAVLLSIVLSRAKDADLFKVRLLPIVAAFSFMVPLATLPTYSRIDQASPYVAGYLEKNDVWFRTVGLNFRDAYFGRRSLGQQEIDKANRWEFQLPIRSVDFVNFRGSVFLSQKGDYGEALPQLYLLIVRNPYWTEPREVVAGIQMRLGQYERAKPQIDTCLMLEPYNPLHHSTLYAFYRNQNDMAMAEQVLVQAHEDFPTDKDITTDYMIYLYRTGKTGDALSLAGRLIAQDKEAPFPYLIRAFSEDKTGDVRAAVADYLTFMDKQVNQPETLMVKQRLDQIKQANGGTLPQR